VRAAGLALAVAGLVRAAGCRTAGLAVARDSEAGGRADYRLGRHYLMDKRARCRAGGDQHHHRGRPGQRLPAPAAKQRYLASDPP